MYLSTNIRQTTNIFSMLNRPQGIRTQHKVNVIFLQKFQSRKNRARQNLDITPRDVTPPKVTSSNQELTMTVTQMQDRILNTITAWREPVVAAAACHRD